MNRTLKRSICLAFCLSLVCSLLPLFAEQSETAPLTLDPEVIEMGAFYGGATLKINGSVDPGTEVIVVVRGPAVEETFNKKRHAGPIWINSGKVHISGVPSLFLSISGRPVDSILSREAIDRFQLDAESIKQQMQVDPEGVDEDVIRDNYMTLKIDEGILQTFEKSVSMGAEAGGEQPFSIEFQWPKRARPNTYEIKAYECRDGAVVGEVSKNLEVVKMGFPAKLSYLASDRAKIYGFLCVLIALIAGFGIDFLASLLGKKGMTAH